MKIPFFPSLSSRTQQEFLFFSATEISLNWQTCRRYNFIPSPMETQPYRKYDEMRRTPFSLLACLFILTKAEKHASNSGLYLLSTSILWKEGLSESFLHNKHLFALYSFPRRVLSTLLLVLLLLPLPVVACYFQTPSG